MLFVSGEKVERFAKAMAAGADLVCIDLEDAVHPGRKVEARAQVLGWLKDAPRSASGPEVALRINGLRTLDGLRDVLAFVESGVEVDWLLLPKTENAGDIQALESWCGAQVGAFTALVETPLGIEHLGAIARAGGKLGALMLGGADLSAELDAQFNWEGLLSARGRLVNAAKSAGLQAWDVPNVDLSSDEGLAARDAQGAGARLRLQDRDPSAADRDDPRRLHADPGRDRVGDRAPEGRAGRPGQRRLPVPGKDGRRAAAARRPAASPSWRARPEFPPPSASTHKEPSMVQTAKRVGENRTRESFGRYYEDFAVGEIYEHRPGRTISETDNTWFTLLTMNTHPMHFDAEYAKASEFGKCIVCSPLTVALMVGMSVTDVSQKAIANLGWTDIKLTHPLFAGDTLYAESEVMDKRESGSRPGAGIVTVKTIGLNQDGKVVGTFNRTMLIAKRGHSVEDKVNY